MLIALEGIDGSGTTTQLEPTQAVVQALGRECHITAEPSTGRIGALIRDVLKGAPMGGAALALLYAADRLDHLTTEITPRLEAGVVVITDRYLMSSFAYQSSDVNLDWVRAINSRAPVPHANVLFDVSVEVAAERRHARGGDPERFDDLDKQRRIADAYDRMASDDRCGPVYRVDADQRIDNVTQQIGDILRDILGSA